MICYKDMTFCLSDCKNAYCERHWTAEKSESARRWWGGDNAPVAFSDFSKRCEEYRND